MDYSLLTLVRLIWYKIQQEDLQKWSIDHPVSHGRPCLDFADTKYSLMTENGHNILIFVILMHCYCGCNSFK